MATLYADYKSGVRKIVLRAIGDTARVGRCTGVAEGLLADAQGRF